MHPAALRGVPCHRWKAGTVRWGLLRGENGGQGIAELAEGELELGPFPLSRGPSPVTVTWPGGFVAVSGETKRR